MNRQDIAAIGLQLWALARVFYRKIELRVLCYVAKKNYDQLYQLAGLLGDVFGQRTFLLSGVHIGLFAGMGYGTDKDGERVSSLCWNAPVGITILIAEQPYYGLGVELRGKALCIRQMQGVQGAPPLTRLKDWPELMVRVCMEHAKDYKLKEVRVYKANQDVNFEFPTTEPQDGQSYQEVLKTHQDRMRRRYDRTAATLKFEKKKRYYVWRVPPPQP